MKPTCQGNWPTDTIDPEPASLNVRSAAWRCCEGAAHTEGPKACKGGNRAGGPRSAAGRHGDLSAADAVPESRRVSRAH